MKQNKRCLIKDKFGLITYKIFMWKIVNSIKRRHHLVAKQLECLLNMSMCIGIPRTEEETAKLAWIYNTYKTLISEIESDMKRVYDNSYKLV